MKRIKNFVRITVLLALILPSVTAYGNIYVVDNVANADNTLGYTGGDLTNTLKKCIRLANANAGLDYINFNITGVAPFTIPVTPALAITDPVFINGFTQPGAAPGAPTIFLNSTGSIDIIQLNAGSSGSTIQGLILYGPNATAGIRVANTTSNQTIAGNFIGTNVTGTAAGGGTLMQNGIILNGVTNCIIGGTTYASRNIISGNSQQGISATSCTTLIIKGNFIGLGVDGTTAIANGQAGINLGNPNTGVTIGGLTAPERNVIATCSNSNSIQVNTCNGITIQGNYIGTDSTGNIGKATRGGINITAGTNVIIGGSTYSARNIIGSTTNNEAIALSSCVTAITIKGNFIGVSKNNTALPNNNLGINITGSPTAVVTIGGSTLPERNIISSNSQTALLINSATSATIQGNYIGTDTTGTVARGNQRGINLTAITGGVTIGGTSYSTRNIIGNCAGNDAITLTTIGNPITIKGNFIGVGTNNSTMTNSGLGINITGSSAANVTIGGLTRQERNIIASNTNGGIVINTATSALLQGNYIGTDSTGMVARANGRCINLNTITAGVTIGGTSYAARNIICNSTANEGIYMTTIGDPIIIKGNFIGIGVDNSAMGNKTYGIQITTSTSANVSIGGTTLPERNVIASNLDFGIRVTNVNSTTIQGNYVGTDTTGFIARGNKGGIYLGTITAGVTVGGTSYLTRNIIGNCSGSEALYMTSCVPTISVKGNFIGLGANNSVMANANAGISINSSATAAVTIGGLTLPERNIIASTTTQTGLSISNAASAIIQGNYIGTDSTGTIARANIRGINLSTIPGGVTIGGTSYSARNIIGNSTGSEGIVMATIGNPIIIKGNFIGIGQDNSAMGNKTLGISINSSTTANVTIGGATRMERNIIASNLGNGLQISNTLSAIIQGNYIGTDSTGFITRGNRGGINLNTITGGVTLGGTNYNTRNIISSCTNNEAVYMNTIGNPVVVKGNFIGLSGDGTTAFPNNNNGIIIGASPAANITIGGPTVPERNIISCNTQNGISINNATTVTIQNNYIGTDSTGTLNRGNRNGIAINTVTGTTTIGGATTNLRNIVSGSTSGHGVSVNTTPGAIIKGNIIGFAIDGTTSMGNINGHGIELISSLKAVIGGLTLPERNLIGNNGNSGINTNTTDSLLVQGNYIGVDVTGLLNKGNGQQGININASKGVTIGGTSYAARNIVSGNGANGIAFNGASPGAIVKANFCGVGKDGVTIIPNQQSGIYFGSSTATGATVGGPTFVERNVASGNGTTSNAFIYSRDGIRFEGGSSNHVIKGNYCGVDSTGTIAIGNVWAGISLNETTDCIVGGTGTYEGNISAANQNEGMYLRNAIRTTIIGNYIGTDKTGNVDLGNEDFGINVRQASLDNTIGGNTNDKRNFIAYTKGIDPLGGAGVFVDSIAHRNKIVRNKIYCNAEKGIHRKTTGNEGIAAPVILTSDVNTMTGTGSIDGDSIHVYFNTKTGGFCDCEGESFVIGTVVSGGTWSVTHNLGLTTAQTGQISATETTANNSTSEFSTCFIPLPVELLSFNVSKQNDHSALITWSTISEKNNDRFEIQRSTDGIHFETIGTVKGNGNSAMLLNYSFVDENPENGINYYKLKQIDFNGAAAYSVIKSVNFSEVGLSVVSDPEGFALITSGNAETKITYEVYSVTGAILARGETVIPMGVYKHKVKLELATGIYIVYAFEQNNVAREKIYFK